MAYFQFELEERGVTDGDYDTGHGTAALVAWYDDDYGIPQLAEVLHGPPRADFYLVPAYEDEALPF